MIENKRNKLKNRKYTYAIQKGTTIRYTIDYGKIDSNILQDDDNIDKIIFQLKNINKTGSMPVTFNELITKYDLT